MHIVRLILAAELSPLGRVSTASLSDQQLMELMLADIGSACTIQDQDGNFTDLTKLKEVTLDDNGNIASIQFNANFGARAYADDFLEPGGEIHLQWMPEHVQTFNCTSFDFIGEIDTSALPAGLQNFDVTENFFSGTLDLTSLPGAMTHFAAQMNNLTGSVDLTALPASLEELDLSNNDFSGSVDFDHLPQGMRAIYLIRNKLSGRLQLLNTPVTLKNFMVYENAFDTSCFVVEIPPSILRVAVDPDFEGSVYKPNGEPELHESLRFFSMM